MTLLELNMIIDENLDLIYALDRSVNHPIIWKHSLLI